MNVQSIQMKLEMKWLLSTVSVFMMVLLMIFSQFAEAKKLGSGGNLGMQKQVAPKSFNTQKDTKTTPTQSNAKTAPAGQASGAAGTAAAGTAAKSGASKWLGPLAGLAVGGLLAAMIFGDAFEGLQIMDFILFALIAIGLFFLVRKMMRKPQTQQQPAYAYQEPQNTAQQPTQFEPETQMQRQNVEPEAADSRSPNYAQPAYNPNAGGSIFGADLDEPVGHAPTADAKVETAPEWFDEAGFIEGAKSHFVQMQAAWDQVDLAQLQGYCTPELFAALQADLGDAQPGDNVTKVDELRAQIAMMAIEGENFVVSVRYSGFVDEDGTGAHAFTEVWHIQRLAAGEGNWLVAGIQQSH